MGARYSGGRSDLSDWPRSVCNAGAPSPRRTQGTVTGLVRRVDALGRIVIPKEIRRTRPSREGDPSRTTLTPSERFCRSLLDSTRCAGIMGEVKAGNEKILENTCPLLLLLWYIYGIFF